MPDSVAGRRYAQRHIEAGLPQLNCPQGQWRQVLVIPAYREPPELLQRLSSLAAQASHCLFILVLNRPDSDPDTQANEALRNAAHALHPASMDTAISSCYLLPPSSCLFLYDTERELGPLPAGQGVGLARKIGCDIAWQWQQNGAIAGNWICSSDADALLPHDYFQRLNDCPETAVAATYPFYHAAGPDPLCNEATALYELRLHHYVLGLQYAGSPYAHHSLGSCLAVRAQAYAQVRGFPRRAGGEDFYLLNKLAKLGPITHLAGECIQLQSRMSQRVPFGTGPAVMQIAAAGKLEDAALFYHPACFVALRAVLATATQLQQASDADCISLLREQGIPDALAQLSNKTLCEMGWLQALQHCRRQGKTREQYLRQFHQWFDAFRTLKFIHALRDDALPQQSLQGLAALQPLLWPGASRSECDVQALLCSIRNEWHWTTLNRARC